MSSFIRYLRWVLPFCYLFKTRLRRRQDLISWVLIHPLPVLFIAFAAHSPEQPLSILFVPIIGLVAFQSLYEIGYIDNDVFTIKHELNPTLRLLQLDAAFLESNFGIVAAGRVAIFVSCLVLIAQITSEQSRVALYPFGLVCAMTMVAFAIHNRVRNRWNIFTYTILSAGRYVSVPLLAWGLDAPGILIVAFLMMPFPRTLEHASKPKYRLGMLQQITVPFERFRPLYYFITLCVYVSVVGFRGEALLGVIVLSLFFIYRLAVFIAVRNRVISPTIHQAYVKKVDKDKS